MSQAAGDYPILALDSSVSKRLRAVAARLRAYVLLEGVARVVGFLLAAFIVQLCLDCLARGLRWSMRATLLAAILSGVAWLCYKRVIQPLGMRMGLAEVANLVERRFPGLASALISAVRFSSGQVGPAEVNSPTLMASAIDRACAQVSTTDFTAVLRPQRARWSAAALLGSLAILVGATLASPQLMGLWFSRNILLQDVAWPKRTKLIVQLKDGKLIGARGDDLIIHAFAQGIQPREVEIVFEDDAKRRGRENMVTVGSEGSIRYRYIFKSVQEDFEFYLQGGDDRTDTYRAILLDRPRVERVEMHIAPPAYARIEPFEIGDDQRTAKILPASDVTIRITTNKPVDKVTLMSGREALLDAVPEPVLDREEMGATANPDASSDGRRYSVTISPRETNTYHFTLVDQVDLENRRPVRISLRIVKDEPPHIRMKLPGVGEMITPEAVLPVELEFADTYGLATAELLYTVSRSQERAAGFNPRGDSGADVVMPQEPPEHSILLPTFKPEMTRFSTDVSWPVSSESLSPGDRLALRARASDFDSVSGPNKALSPETILRVVTRDELLAELARHERELRMDFERLIDIQERLRSDLLTLIGRNNAHEPRAESNPDLSGARADFATALAPLERRQRTIAGSVNVVRQQFAQILTELEVNQLDTLDERERLETGIIAPLAQLAKRELITAADTIRQWSRDPSTETQALIDPQQVELLAQMRAILAFMIQWEGYHEVVNMLRDIVRLQNQLKTETQDAVVDEAGDVFED